MASFAPSHISSLYPLIYLLRVEARQIDSVIREHRLYPPLSNSDYLQMNDLLCTFSFKFGKSEIYNLYPIHSTPLHTIFSDWKLRFFSMLYFCTSLHFEKYSSLIFNNYWFFLLKINITWFLLYNKARIDKSCTIYENWNYPFLIVSQWIEKLSKITLLKFVANTCV